MSLLLLNLSVGLPGIFGPFSQSFIELCNELSFDKKNYTFCSPIFSLQSYAHLTSYFAIEIRSELIPTFTCMNLLNLSFYYLSFLIVVSRHAKTNYLNSEICVAVVEYKI